MGAVESMRVAAGRAVQGAGERLKGLVAPKTGSLAALKARIFRQRVSHGGALAGFLGLSALTGPSVGGAYAGGASIDSINALSGADNIAIRERAASLQSVGVNLVRAEGIDVALPPGYWPRALNEATDAN